MIFEPMVHLAQTVRLSCVKISIVQMDRNEITLEPHDLEVPLGVSKMTSEPMVCSMETVHLSCVKISANSNWTVTSFHLSLVT